ncbi:MAG: S-methyl-5'-thioinosine phosphorylase [Casimicrobiaceae bacterium]
MLAIIGGSGLDSLPDLEAPVATRVATPFGAPVPEVVSGRLCGLPMLFLARHGAEHRSPPHRINYRANIHALKSLGATDIVAVAAVGGISGHPPGSLAIPHQLIDYTSGREATFFDGSELPLTHVDFTRPYSLELRALCLAAARRAGVGVIDGGVYAAVNGPRLETAAEIDRLQRDGATIVGMTGMPEASLAREAGVAYASVALCINHAAGRGDSLHAIAHGDLARVLATGMQHVRALLRQIALDRKEAS